MHNYYLLIEQEDERIIVFPFLLLDSAKLAQMFETRKSILLTKEMYDREYKHAEEN